MSNKILKGTLLLTSAAFLSKFLGLIYVIPFNELVGAKGGALYYYAYNPYTILIGISTVGIPMAVSKIVSKYNSLGYYHISRKILRIGLSLTIITGFVAFIALYFGAEWLASRFIYDDNHGNSVEDVKQVIRMVSFALILIPSMSVVRGFFQGNERMEPTAISQVVEQIVRISFVLIAAFIIVKVYQSSVVLAVSYATFAAFIGALASSIVLFLFWRNWHFDVEPVHTNRRMRGVSTKALTIELFSYAGVFILVGITIPLYQMVDSFTFNKAMFEGGFGDISELSLSTINFYGHKVIIMPVTLATGLSLTIVPALTASFTKNEYSKLTKEMNQALQIVLFFVIPAVVGLSTLAYEAYGALYGLENIAITGELLMWYAPVALFFALFTVTVAILQGINEQRFTLLSIIVGFLIKVVLNTYFIHMFAGKGSILATEIAVCTAVVMNLWRIHRAVHFSYIQTFKRGLFMVIFSIMMWLSIVIVKSLFGLFLPYESSRVAAIMMLFIGIATGAFVYLFLSYKSTLMDFVLGNMKIMNRFRRKKG